MIGICIFVIFCLGIIWFACSIQSLAVVCVFAGSNLDRNAAVGFSTVAGLLLTMLLVHFSHSIEVNTFNIVVFAAVTGIAYATAIQSPVFSPARNSDIRDVVKVFAKYTGLAMLVAIAIIALSWLLLPGFVFK